MRQTAIAAAAAGAEVLSQWAGGSHDITATEKGPADYVTQADLAAEAAVIAMLSEKTPKVPVLSEEAGGQPIGDGLLWVVDPLDGTTNFLHRFPVVGVSIALLADAIPYVAAVSAPLLQKSWSAALGDGATDEANRRLAVSAMRTSRTLVATGFPFRIPHRRQEYLPVFLGAMSNFEDLRRAGTASLDLAYTAAGSFDGYFELGLSPWDVAAGALLVREAGGIVTDWDGDGASWLHSGDILAGAPDWHEKMLSLIAGARAG